MCKRGPTRLSNPRIFLHISGQTHTLTLHWSYVFFRSLLRLHLRPFDEKIDAATTVEAKMAFECMAHSHNVVVKHYHCDNGLFDTKLFKQSIRTSNQIIFCGVNAHHQNGKSERRIKDITESARTALLHAAHRWPKAIHPSLWPCALKH